MSGDSIKRLDVRKAMQEPEIDIETDGHFHASRVPGGMVGIEGSSKAIDAAGHWRITRVDGDFKLLLVFETVTGVSSGRLPYGRTMEISANRKPDRIYCDAA